MRALLALFLLLPLAACGGDHAPAASSTTPVPSPVVLRDTGAVELRVGQQLVVALDANATTGYEWRITAEPVPGVLAVASGPTYEPAPTTTSASTTPIVGAGGTTTTRFTAAGIGTTRVVLSYRRVFEPNEPDARTVTVEVTVRS